MAPRRLPTEQELSGRPPREIGVGTISGHETQRFAIAVRDLNPLYFDADFARRAGYDDIIAPPTYLPAVLDWTPGVNEGDLLPDGTDPAFVIEEMHGCRLMGGGQSIELHQPVYPGHVVTKLRRLASVSRKQSKLGPVIIAVFDDRYVERHAGLLVSCRDTFMGIEAG